jgi:hypothetical protein
MMVGDEDLTADGDTAEGGSSGYPSEEEKNDDESEEESDEDDPKGKRSQDDSSSVKSIRIFPRKAHRPSVDDQVEGGGYPERGSYDDVSAITSSVY